MTRFSNTRWKWRSMSSLNSLLSIFSYIRKCISWSNNTKLENPRGRFSKDLVTYRARKTIFETTFRLPWKAALLTCFRYKEMQNNTQVSKLETCSYWRCKGICVTRKVSGLSINGPQVPLCLITICVFLFYLQFTFCLRFAFLIAFHFFYFRFAFLFLLFYLRFAFFICVSLFYLCFAFLFVFSTLLFSVFSILNLCFLFLICIFFFYLCFLFCLCLTLLGHRNLELDHVYKITLSRIFNYRIDVKFPCFK